MIIPVNPVCKITVFDPSIAAIPNEYFPVLTEPDKAFNLKYPLPFVPLYCTT
jgi:hypothetical protein